jgi:hypothetical protein
MSNEIQCNLLVYGPVEPSSTFTTKFKRDELLADVPIQAGEPDDRKRRQAAHGTRCIYPNPGIRLQTQDEIQEILRNIAREGYENYVPPTSHDKVVSLTFTTPSDPPGRWIATVIDKHFDSGLSFMLRWQELDNYHRCVTCGAFDGFCTRVGAFWSVADGWWEDRMRYKHVASWWGRNPCKCEKRLDYRPIWKAEQEDDYAPGARELCSIAAVHETGRTIRVISTNTTGIRTMTRQVVCRSDRQPATEAAAAEEAIQINKARMTSLPTQREEADS